MERDLDKYVDFLLFKNFNSHAHVERDDSFEFEEINGEISTHTLTWSVTVYSDKQTDSHANFNSHAHVERDLWVLNAH